NMPDGVEAGLEATHRYDPPNATYPSGTHVCVVEVDTETGFVEVVNYVAVDDGGELVDPTMAEAMVHGGIVQGISEAMFEEAVYDDPGSLVSGTMVDYHLPSAAD